MNVLDCLHPVEANLIEYRNMALHSTHLIVAGRASEGWLLERDAEAYKQKHVEQLITFLCDEYGTDYMRDFVCSLGMDPDDTIYCLDQIDLYDLIMERPETAMQLTVERTRTELQEQLNYFRKGGTAYDLAKAIYDAEIYRIYA